MIFGSSREEFRQTFFNAFQKHREQKPLEPVEEQLVQIILAHPEYHFIFDNDENQFHDAWENQRTENPFLHMSLHLAIRDQIALNQPLGITEIFQALVKKTGDAHEAEHQMMLTISLTIQKMLKENKVFDAQDYLTQLKSLL